MNTKLLSIIGLVSFLLTACAQAVTSVPPTATPEPTPTPLPDTVRHQTWSGNEWMKCPITMQVSIGDVVVFQKEETIVFDTRGSVFLNPEERWYQDWNRQVAAFEEEAAKTVSAKVISVFGLESVWQPRYSWNSLFTVGLPEALWTYAPDRYENVDCPPDWKVPFSVTPGDSEGNTDWKVLPVITGQNIYLTVSDGQNGVEIPLYPDEIRVVMEGFDPTHHQATFVDPAANVGPEHYEQAVIDYAAGIMTNGVLVGRFGWVSIEGQDVIHNVLARALILKAATSDDTHQAAFFAYLRDKTIATTSVTVTSNPVRGAFFLGIGTVSGGDSRMQWQQTITSVPEIRGDLYLLNK